MNTPKQVLHVTRTLNYGGIETMMLNYIKHSSMNLSHTILKLNREEGMRSKFEGLKQLTVIDFIDQLSLSWFSFLKDLNSYLSSNKFDAIVCWFYPFHGIVAMIAKLNGINKIVTHIGMVQNFGSWKEHFKFALLFYLGRLTGCQEIAVSDRVRRSIQASFKVSTRNVTKIYNGIDLNLFHPIHEKNVSKSDFFLVGTVARLDQYKDFDTLFRSISTINNHTQTKIRLQIAGDGPERKRLEALAQELHIDRLIDWLGFVSDIPSFLQSIDAFVFSATPSEGLGISMLEAMACELPIIATLDTVCEEVIENEVLGLLVPPKNEELMAKAILTLIKHPISARKMGTLARKRCNELFSLHDTVDKYSKLILS